MFTIDTDTDLGARTAERLESDLIVWLTSVSPKGDPAPLPVWFIWTGGELIVATPASAVKLRNIAANPRVAVHFNATAEGGDIQVANGLAAHDPAGLSDSERAAYDAKYAAGMQGLGLTPEAFHAQYSEIIRITPSRLRGF